MKKQRSQAQQLRWSLAMMSREFGPDHKTLSKNLAASGITAGKDGLFSSRDALRLVFGDLEAERLRKTREEADKLELENEQTRGNLLETEAVYRHFERVFVAFRQKVLASSLTEEEKYDLLNDLCRLKTRDLPRAGAGVDSRAAVPGADATAALQRAGVGGRAAVPEPGKLGAVGKVSKLVRAVSKGADGGRE